MTQPTTELSLRRTITVEAPIERAFSVFTDGFDTWWAREYHIGATEMERAVLEPGVGGRWYERGVDGSECDWGRVLVWEPHTRLVVAWQIGADWRYDPGFVTEVEVHFVAEGPGRTRVELEHRDLDHFGDAAQAMGDTFDSPGGWDGLLQSYARAAEGQ